MTVLEAERQVIDSPRAMVYHWALHDDLHELGLLEEIERRGFRKDDYGYRVHSTGETVTYNLDALAGETPFPYNVHLGQDELCALVLERLADTATTPRSGGGPGSPACARTAGDEIAVATDSDDGARRGAARAGG